MWIILFFSRERLFIYFFFLRREEELRPRNGWENWWSGRGVKWLVSWWGVSAWHLRTRIYELCSLKMVMRVVGVECVRGMTGKCGGWRWGVTDVVSSSGRNTSRCEGRLCDGQVACLARHLNPREKKSTLVHFFFLPFHVPLMTQLPLNIYKALP